MKTRTYIRIPRNSKRPPYGYSAEDDELIPNQAILEALEKTIQFIEYQAFSGYRPAAQYLSYETGVPISNEGLRLIHKLKKHPVLFGRKDYLGDTTIIPFRESDGTDSQEATEAVSEPVGNIS